MALLSFSRREAIATLTATGCGAITSSCDTAVSPPPEIDGATQLQLSAGRLVELVADPSERTTANKWLTTAMVETATKFEFSDSSETHRLLANNFVLRHPEGKPLELRRSGGINFHPWLHINGYNVAATLNNQEIFALSSSEEYFDHTLKFYQDGQLKYIPFPDTERLAPTQIQLDRFFFAHSKGVAKPGQLSFALRPILLDDRWRGETPPASGARVHSR